MDSDIGHRKRALRAELRERRQNMTSVERDAATAGLTANLQSITLDLSARSISCYLSSRNEPNTRPFVNWAESQGIRVLFPVSRDDGLLDWTVGEDQTETPGLAGVPEPAGELLGPIAINDVDLIVVPAAAVDATGLRMGWGRGYYDKTLGSMEKCPPVYAVIYDNEFVDEVPREVHDQPVDGLVTPSRIIAF
ncbi:5-formyltetrahydrofolate cyclo-ligase [Cryobacterium sp. TMT1-21]|uniref:5-formyltetrahydrofolate cyclo-ligase n=1 Tax=Cryobacterium shii TaxID=1259235 RepID=A0AAQ2HFH9_9MICO|nr:MULTISPECIES: 5-formyltetrahydrofolate cyclo-ligase [Cryobacterium]TFC46410.1 5-formyltetrahydrofolate cyclo-ligase [Cryobacterium shii]TFC84307.1 5-formyltetrahydrofolate cyclo-ligase [Cryobacterium sp. TmT2-59]TFD12098.1 5-formyltetrahydrofolate cyclo-ligase [Cryobacterium sp. TMT4-10]TFD17332.1 5-formyltetrahydrofolate cyclo-ligase [Cryobacterium sp. TMT1-21]TFD17723.1 5-formyltetrahydrofolate cyclo-ligase [Cryobacterium sp. TMT2-23]